MCYIGQDAYLGTIIDVPDDEPLVAYKSLKFDDFTSSGYRAKKAQITRIYVRSRDVFSYDIVGRIDQIKRFYKVPVTTCA